MIEQKTNSVEATDASCDASVASNKENKNIFHFFASHKVITGITLVILLWLISLPFIEINIRNIFGRRGTSTHQIGLHVLDVIEFNGLVVGLTSTSMDINPYLSIEFSDNIISHATRQRVEQALVSDEGHVLRFENDGSITFRDANVNWGAENMGLQMNEAQAVEAAKSHLDSLGLLPTDSNYRLSVSSIQRALLDITTGEFTGTETIDFTVNFYRQVNGVDIFTDRGDGISIRFNANGITNLHHNWRNMTVVQERRSVTSDQISIEQAIEAYIGFFREYYAHHDLPEMIIVSNAYIIRNGIVTAVWVFSEDHDFLNMVMFDVTTGERVSMHQFS